MDKSPLANVSDIEDAKFEMETGAGGLFTKLIKLRWFN